MDEHGFGQFGIGYRSYASGHVGVLAPRIDRYGCEHILLTDQPNRYVQRGPAVRQVVPEERQAIRMLAESAQIITVWTA